MRFSVYVAGSSKEPERAARAMNALRAADIEVTSTWVDVIAASGGASNPESITHEQRYDYAIKDVSEVANARVLWLLMPQSPSMGAFFEFGFARARGHQVLVSGANQYASIFTALAHGRCDTDEEALDVIIQMKHRAQLPLER